MRIASTPEARRLVRERGGTLYVTLDAASGGALVSTDPPAGPVDTDGFDGGGYLLVLDRRLPMAAELRVSASAAGLAVETSGAAWRRA